MEKFINDIRRLVAIPSFTDSEEVTEALDKALEISGELGFKAVKLNDTVGYAEIGQGEKMIGILAHLDVVPVGGEWKHEPFSGEIEDGRMYGRGVFDDKGAVLCTMYAVRDIIDTGRILNKRIRVIFGTHEEEGNWDDIEYYKAHEELPDYGFTPDSSFPVTYAEKGLARYYLYAPLEDSGFKALEGGTQVNIVPESAACVLDDGTAIRTYGKSAHGSKPWLGENAVDKLMEEAAEKGTPFARNYVKLFGRDCYGTGAGIGYVRDDIDRTTVNIGKAYIEGNEIVLEMDVRYCTTKSEKDVRSDLHKTLDPYGFRIEKFDFFFTEPVYMDPEGEYIKCLSDAYSLVTGDVESVPELSGAGTYAAAMPNIVAFGPLLPGRESTAHQEDEYFLLEDLKKARQIYRRAIENILEL